MRARTVRFFFTAAVVALPAWLALGLSAGVETRQPRSEPPRRPPVELERKLEELRLRHESGAAEAKSYEIEEREANAYLRRRSGEELPRGIENPWVRFDEGFAVLGATLDLDEVKHEMPDSMLLQLLTGKVPVELTARLDGRKGIGRLELERVLLAGVELPTSLVESLAAKHDASGVLPPGFRLGEPFPLPYDLDTIRLQRGAAMVRQRASRVDR